MYCKKCGKDYPKKKKVCKDCGIALTPGMSPLSAKKGANKVAIIVVIAVMLAVVALFLIIGLSGMVPQDLKGVWYETTGFGGTLEFKPNGVLNYSAFGDEKIGSYEYNSSTGEGELLLDVSDESVAIFTCDGIAIEMEGTKFTRQEVGQLDFNEILEGIIDD